MSGVSSLDSGDADLAVGACSSGFFFRLRAQRRRNRRAPRTQFPMKKPPMSQPMSMNMLDMTSMSAIVRKFECTTRFKRGVA